MNKHIVSILNLALIALCLFSCKAKKTGVEDVFAAFPLEEIKNLVPANWEAKPDEANNRIEIVSTSNDEGTPYSKVSFVVYYKPDDDVFVSITATPNTDAEDFQALCFEGNLSDDKSNWQWTRYELYDFLMKDFLAENALADHADDKVLPYLDVDLSKDTVHCAINDFRFFRDVQQNLVEDSEYNEVFENTYLKYEYDFVWEGEGFKKYRSVRKDYDSLCAETALEVGDSAELEGSDYSHIFSVTALESTAVGESIEFTYTTSDYPFAGQFFYIKNSGIKKIRIEIDGNPICRVALSDTDKFQSFPIQKREVSKEGTRIRFVIEEIYPGENNGDVVFIPNMDETVTDPIQEKILKWDGVTMYVYGMMFLFTDANGGSFRANSIDITDFNIDDNEYFEMNTGDVPEGQDAGYSLKEAIKDKWYRVQYRTEEKELPGGVTGEYVTVVGIQEY